MISVLILVVALAVLFTLMIWKNIIVIDAPMEAYKLRLGTPYEKLSSGIHFIFWPLEKLYCYNWIRTDENARGEGVRTRYRGKYISSSEMIYDPPAYVVVTQDRLSISINIVVHYRIVNLKKAFFSVDDLYASMESRLETCILQCASGMSLEQAVDGRAHFYDAIIKEFAECIDKWGVRITRLDVQGVTPSDDIIKATQVTVAKKRKEAAEFQRKEMFLKGEMAQIEMEYAKKDAEIKARAQAAELEQRADAEYSMRGIENTETAKIYKARAKKDIAFIEAEARKELYLMDNEEAIARATANSETIRLKFQAENAGHGMHVKAMLDGGLSNSNFVDIMKWEHLGRMAESGTVQFMPQEALSLLGSMKVYRNVADTAARREK